MVAGRSAVVARMGSDRTELVAVVVVGRSACTGFVGPFVVAVVAVASTEVALGCFEPSVDCIVELEQPDRIGSPFGAVGIAVAARTVVQRIAELLVVGYAGNQLPIVSVLGSADATQKLVE